MLISGLSTHPSLYSTGLVTRNFRWIWDSWYPNDIDSSNGVRARVQFRHRMSDIPCIVKGYATAAFGCNFTQHRLIYSDRHQDGELLVRFAEPQLAVTSGQVAALYDDHGQWCLGSGEIARAVGADEPGVP